jgi:hypothetical protein
LNSKFGPKNPQFWEFLKKNNAASFQMPTALIPESFINFLFSCQQCSASENLFAARQVAASLIFIFKFELQRNC